MKKLLYLIVLSGFSFSFLIANECLKRCQEKYETCKKAEESPVYAGMPCKTLLSGCKSRCYLLDIRR